MKVHFNTIKSRLLIGFFFLTINIIFLSTFSYLFLRNAEDLANFTNKIYQLKDQSIQLIKLDKDFLTFELANERFYRENTSDILQQRDTVYLRLKKNFDLLYSEISAYDDNIHYELTKVDSLVSLYNKNFAMMTLKLRERGFKDYGLEGQMRNFAHELEDYHYNELPLSDLLLLRRHEKDYFLRNDTTYIIKLNQLSRKILSNLGQNEKRFFKVMELVENYTLTFNQLTMVEQEIGLLSHQGLNGKLNVLNSNISSQFDKLTAITDTNANHILNQATITYTITVILSILLSLSLSYFIASRLTKPIKQLSLRMARFMDQKNLDVSPPEQVNSADEIKQLNQSFFELSKELRAQFAEIKEKKVLLETQNEELSRVNTQLDRFIYSAAHDLRSPLSSLLGLVDIARHDINNESYAHYFEMMKASIHKLDNFIKDIVDYARNKRQDLRVEEVPLKPLIQGVLDHYRFIKGAERIEKIIEADEDIIFPTDKRRLEVILSNLVSNAFRYHDQEKDDPYIRVIVRPQKDQFKLVVEDNGIGIKEKHLERLFDMFYRADEQAEGSGLGLFIVKETINVLKGEITVSSCYGEGTSFTLTLPNLAKLTPDEKLAPSNSLIVGIKNF